MNTKQAYVIVGATTTPDDSTEEIFVTVDPDGCFATVYKDRVNAEQAVAENMKYHADTTVYNILPITVPESIKYNEDLQLEAEED